MDISKIEELVKQAYGKAEAILTDEEKRKELIADLTNGSKLIEEISEKVKDLPMLIEMVKDYFNGSYKALPTKSIIALIATLLYVINPFDLLPDAIPVIGITDDIAAIGLCVKAIDKDFTDYKNWKKEQI